MKTKVCQNVKMIVDRWKHQASVLAMKMHNNKLAKMYQYIILHWEANTFYFLRLSNIPKRIPHLQHTLL